jgi:hypothetical protein
MSWPDLWNNRGRNNFLLLFFGALGFWTQGFKLAKQALLLLELLHQPFFVLGFFEIESHQLFALG